MLKLLSIASIVLVIILAIPIYYIDVELLIVYLATIVAVFFMMATSIYLMLQIFRLIIS